MPIIFGPAGLGGINEAIPNMENMYRLGIKACEIAFTYGVYIKKREDALRIGKAAKEFGIKLSIHAPYWINLNSDDPKKIEESKKRILACCEIGTYLGAYRVVFHPGYYGKRGRGESYEIIRDNLIELQDEIKEKGYTPRLAPETTGKINVFGSVDEICRLSEETGCSFCIDFAHILARYKAYNFKDVLKKFEKYEELHIHFSGIEYGEKGEKNHKKTTPDELKKLISNLPKDKEIAVINESPSPLEDSLLGLEIYRRQE